MDNDKYISFETPSIGTVSRQIIVSIFEGKLNFTRIYYLPAWIGYVEVLTWHWENGHWFGREIPIRSDQFRKLWEKSEK